MSRSCSGYGWSPQAGRLLSGGGGCNTCRAGRSATSAVSTMCWTSYRPVPASRPLPGVLSAERVVEDGHGPRGQLRIGRLDFFLAGTNVTTVPISDLDDVPCAGPVFYVNGGFCLYWPASTRDRLGAYLQANPRATVTALSSGPVHRPLHGIRELRGSRPQRHARTGRQSHRQAGRC